MSPKIYILITAGRCLFARSRNHVKITTTTFSVALLVGILRFTNTIFFFFLTCKNELTHQKNNSGIPSFSFRFSELPSSSFLLISEAGNGSHRNSDATTLPNSQLKMVQFTSGTYLMQMTFVNAHSQSCNIPSRSDTPPYSFLLYLVTSMRLV